MNVSTAVATLKGAIQSLTIWVAALAEVFGEIAPLVTPDSLTSLGLEPHTVTLVCRWFATAMILCRLVTSKSLADKVVTPVPPSVPNQKGYALMTRSTPFFLPILMALAATAVLLMNSGCALVTKLESPAAQPFDQVAVAAGVDAIVMQAAGTASQAARASSIKTVATQILAADTGTTADLSSLEQIAQAKITALALPPGDQAAAALLLATLDAAINAYSSKLATNATVANAKTAVATVLGWVITECNKFMPTAEVIPPAGGGITAMIQNFPLVLRADVAVGNRA